MKFVSKNPTYIVLEVISMLRGQNKVKPVSAEIIKLYNYIRPII